MDHISNGVPNFDPALFGAEKMRQGTAAGSEAKSREALTRRGVAGMRDFRTTLYPVEFYMGVPINEGTPKNGWFVVGVS